MTSEFDSSGKSGNAINMSLFSFACFIQYRLRYRYHSTCPRTLHLIEVCFAFSCFLYLFFFQRVLRGGGWWLPPTLVENETPPDISIKVAWSYFSKFCFIFHLKDHQTEDVNLKFQLNWSNCFDLVSNFVYCSFLYNYYM